MAPVIPFMTEHIWQELTRKVLRGAELSVHLSDWPKPIEGVHDDGVLESTALSRDVIATAMRLRNESQIKVRQPLAVLYVCCTPEQAGKIGIFEQSVLDELNIKEIKYIEDKSVFENAYLAVNFKVSGAVLKQNVNKMKQSLSELDGEAMAALVAQFDRGENIQVPGWEEAYDASVFLRQTATRKGIVSAECSAEMVVALDTAITEELKKEGAVRDIIRQCQILRKDAGYQVEQHVAVSIVTADAFLGGALKDDQAHIASELLADSIVFEAMEGADLSREMDTEYGAVAVAVKKA